MALNFIRVRQIPSSEGSTASYTTEYGNTVVTQTSEIEPKGMWRSLQLVLTAIIRKQSDAETATLRELLNTKMHEVDEEMEIVNISKTVVSVEG